MKITPKAQTLYNSLIVLCTIINEQIDKGWILVDKDSRIMGYTRRFVFSYMSQTGIALSRENSGVYFSYLHYENCDIYGKRTFYQECKAFEKILNQFKLINPKDAIPVYKFVLDPI